MNWTDVAQWPFPKASIRMASRSPNTLRWYVSGYGFRWPEYMKGSTKLQYVILSGKAHHSPFIQFHITQHSPQVQSAVQSQSVRFSSMYCSYSITFFLTVFKEGVGNVVLQTCCVSNKLVVQWTSKCYKLSKPTVCGQWQVSDKIVSLLNMKSSRQPG